MSWNQCVFKAPSMLQVGRLQFLEPFFSYSTEGIVFRYPGEKGTVLSQGLSKVHGWRIDTCYGS